MLPPDAARVGYVVKVYPRYSETFIVTEVLAHETAGLAIELFALRPPTDSHFQDLLARVRAPVHYVPHSSLDAGDFWAALGAIGATRPDLWSELVAARTEDARDVYQALWLARAARERGLTHLHAHFASTATTVTRLAARFAGLPYSFTAHAKDIFHLDVQPQDLRRKLSEATAVVTVSDYNRDYLRAAHGTFADHVERIYNGLELDRFPYTAPIDRPPHIVAVGRLVEKKGFADLIDASALLAERGRSFTCQIIGAGELEGALRAQVERLGLAAVIEFTGLRPQREIVDLIQRAAVFAAPCVVGADGNRDGLPTVLLEAMALGTPCVSTPVTGIPELVRHEETGLLVPEHAPEALANAIERLFDDGALRVALAGRARDLIETEFDSHRNGARQRALFQAALAPLPGVG